MKMIQTRHWRAIAPRLLKRAQWKAKSFALIFILFLSYSAIATGLPENLPPITVTGKITDESGQGIAGVSVTEKGTQNGSTTDANGFYKLTVSDENAILVFSMVGYGTQEMKVGSRSAINVTLRSGTTSMDEVVVTASIENHALTPELTINCTLNMMTALTGKAAGVIFQV
jgi:hypothetical protein